VVVVTAAQDATIALVYMAAVLAVLVVIVQRVALAAT